MQPGVVPAPRGGDSSAPKGDTRTVSPPNPTPAPGNLPHPFPCAPSTLGTCPIAPPVPPAPISPHLGAVLGPGDGLDEPEDGLGQRRDDADEGCELLRGAGACDLGWTGAEERRQDAHRARGAQPGGFGGCHGGPTVLQVVEGEVPDVRGEVGQGQEPPGGLVPEEAGPRAVREQPVLDDLRGAGRCRQRPKGFPVTQMGGVPGGLCSPPAWCARSYRRRRSRRPTGTASAAAGPARAPGGCSARRRGSVGRAGLV